MLRMRGKVLPTKPMVMPVSRPVTKGRRKRIGKVGIPSSIKNWLTFLTAPEDFHCFLEEHDAQYEENHIKREPMLET